MDQRIRINPKEKAIIVKALRLLEAHDPGEETWDAYNIRQRLEYGDRRSYRLSEPKLRQARGSPPVI